TCSACCSAGAGPAIGAALLRASCRATPDLPRGRADGSDMDGSRHASRAHYRTGGARDRPPHPPRPALRLAPRRRPCPRRPPGPPTRDTTRDGRDAVSEAAIVVCTVIIAVGVVLGT